jgi:hypothetical protein
MPEDRARLDAIAASHASVADKIRALAAAGVPRADIARFLGKRYQHVRNVLEDDTQRAAGGFVLGRAELSGVREDAPQFDPLPDERQWVERRAPGAYWLRPQPDGRLVLPREVAEALGVTDGRRVFATFAGGRLEVVSSETAMAEARAMVRRYIPPGANLADELVADRRAEAAREDRGG